jgi:hypothetical protein
MTRYLFIYLSRARRKPRNDVIEASNVWEAWRRFRKTHVNALNVLNIRVT